MNRPSMIWAALMLAGLVALGTRAATGNMGREYVRAVSVANGQWTQYNPSTYGEYVRAEARKRLEQQYQSGTVPE